MIIKGITKATLSRYEQWSEAFKLLKRFKSPVDQAVEDVLTFYRRPVDSWHIAKRAKWKHSPGFRKNVPPGKERGEQIIERYLLRNVTEPLQITGGPNNRSVDFYCTDHNFPLAAFNKGQVLCDVFGYLRSRSGAYRPIAVEVKDTNGNPWFAVVENLIQVRLARANVNNVERWMRSRAGESARVRGTLGMIVAPAKYYSRHPQHTEAATKLIQGLAANRGTEARITMCVLDMERGALQWVPGSYWPG